MENDNQEQTQAQSTEKTESKEQPKAKEEPTVTKQIEKMRKRIDKEVGQRKETEDKNNELEKQVKTLTDKLKSIQGNDKEEEQPQNPELDKAMSENQKLKAQLIRRDQMDTVSQQFNEAGVIVPKDVLNLVVPTGIDEKQVSANMKALSSFYDSIVEKTKHEFLKADTPRTTGTDEKPFDKSEYKSMNDPRQRIEYIKEHMDEFE